MYLTRIYTVVIGVPRTNVILNWHKTYLWCIGTIVFVE